MAVTFYITINVRGLIFNTHILITNQLIIYSDLLSMFYWNILKHKITYFSVY